MVLALTCQIPQLSLSTLARLSLGICTPAHNSQGSLLPGCHFVFLSQGSAGFSSASPEGSNLMLSRLLGGHSVSR